MQLGEVFEDSACKANTDKTTEWITRIHNKNIASFDAVKKNMITENRRM